MIANLPTPVSFHAAHTSAELTGAAPIRPGDAETKQKFQEILGELLFGQMLKSMRRTVDQPAYFHGGRAEEIFTQQLDQVLAQELGRSAGEQFLGPMYELWSAGRR